MRRDWFRVFSAALLAVSLLTLSACGPKAKPAEKKAEPAPTSGQTAQPAQTQPQQPPAPKGELVEVLVNNPVQLNPILTSDLIGNGIVARVFSGLVRIGPKMEVLPEIAAKWSSSPDGLEWTFELRKDVKFHDGKPLTAEDVAYTFNAIKDKGYTGPRGSVFKALQKATVVDPSTVKFTLSEPFAPFLSTLTYGILPKHLFDKEPIGKMKDNPLNRKPVGSGPFKLTEWKEGEHIILEANPDHYVKGEPKLARIRYKFVPDSNVATAQFEAGQIDIYAPPGKDVKRLQTTLGDKVKSYTFETLGYNYLGLNNARFGLSEKAVRQAIAHAVNRDQIVKNVLAGQAVVVHTDTPPASQWHNPNIPKYNFDPKKAAELLDGAGYKLGQDGIRAKDNKKMSYVMMYSAGSSSREAMAQLMQSNLKDVGIAVELRPLETSVFLQKYVWMGDFDMMINSFSLGIDPDMYSRFHSSQAQKDKNGRFVGFNRIGYINKELDALIEAGRRETDPAKRRTIYNQAQAILAEEVPNVFLYATTATEMIKSKFRGLVEGYSGYMYPWKWETTDGG